MIFKISRKKKRKSEIKFQRSIFVIFSSSFRDLRDTEVSVNIEGIFSLGQIISVSSSQGTIDYSLTDVRLSVWFHVEFESLTLLSKTSKLSLACVVLFRRARHRLTAV